METGIAQNGQEITFINVSLLKNSRRGPPATFIPRNEGTVLLNTTLAGGSLTCEGVQRSMPVACDVPDVNTVGQATKRHGPDQSTAK